MLKDFVLGTEIAREGKFDIANISMTISDFGLVEGIDYLKFGGITLLSKKSLVIPNNIYAAMFSENITDMSNYIPYNWFMEQIENHTNLIKDRYELVEIGAYTDLKGKYKKGKRFIKITDDELQNIMFNEKLVKYVVDLKEIAELEAGNFIDGHIKLSNKKELIWY